MLVDQHMSPSIPSTVDYASWFSMKKFGQHNNVSPILVPKASLYRHFLNSFLFSWPKMDNDTIVEEGFLCGLHLLLKVAQIWLSLTVLGKESS